MPQKYSSLTFAVLEDFLQQMSAPTQLDDHALVSLLWETPLVKNHLALHPKDQTLPRGRIVGLALRSFLHSSKPPRLFAKLKVSWNKFLFLDVKYFYPFAHLTRFPKSYSELGVWLYDKDQLTLVIADGDPLAAKRLATENQDFWEALIPDDAVPSPQTLSARHKSSIKDFREALIDQLELWDSLLSSEMSGVSVSDKPQEPSPDKPLASIEVDTLVENDDLQLPENQSQDDSPLVQTESESSPLDSQELFVSSLTAVPTDISEASSSFSQEGSTIASSINDVSSLTQSIGDAPCPAETSSSGATDDLNIAVSSQNIILEDLTDDTLLPDPAEKQGVDEISLVDAHEFMREQVRKHEQAREEQLRRWESASLFLREYFSRYNRGQFSSPYFLFSPPYGGVVSPQELEHIAHTIDWEEFFAQHEIRCPKTEPKYWRNDLNLVNNLLGIFRETKSIDTQVKSAVLLRQCDLLVHTNMVVVTLSRFKFQRLLVAEDLAQITMNPNFTSFRRSLAEAILAQDKVLLALVKRGIEFVPFVHTTALKMGKRLEYDFSLKYWFITAY